MDRNVSSFTVCFQDPFWVGIAERWEEGRYQAARVVFGPEPTDAQLWEWLEREWHRLEFTDPADAPPPKALPAHPKKARRQAGAALHRQSGPTRAQQALSRQREADAQAREEVRRQKKRERQEEQFRLKQEKKREKRRGH